MLYGEHLSADEIAVQCPCGIAATVEVFDAHGVSIGWFCRTHAHHKHKELRKLAKIARAIIRRAP